MLAAFATPTVNTGAALKRIVCRASTTSRNSAGALYRTWKISVEAAIAIAKNKAKRIINLSSFVPSRSFLGKCFTQKYSTNSEVRLTAICHRKAQAKAIEYSYGCGEMRGIANV